MSKLEVSKAHLIPFATVGGVITVNCMVLDTRTVYGRVEWKVAPIDGDGTTWVTEKAISDGTGARVDAAAQKRNVKRKAEAQN